MRMTVTTWARFGLLAGLLVALQMRLWQADGLFNVYRLQKKVTAQTEALQNDRTRNQRLSAQLKWLYHSKEAIEYHARESLGMIKPGETFYLWVEKHPD